MLKRSASKEPCLFALKPVARAVRADVLGLRRAAVLAFGGAAPVVLAQGSGLAIEEVIVTAQKRDESVQDVPISIDVLGQADLEEHGVTDLEDFVQLSAFG